MRYSAKQQAGDSQPPFTSHLNISLSLHRKSVFLSLFLIFLLLGAALTAVVAGTSEGMGDDDGIPKNWFPSATAFVVFVISLYLFHITGRAGKPNRYIYLLLAFFSIAVSMYYGSNLYAHRLWETGPGMFPGKALKLFGMLATLMLFMRLIFVSEDKWSRIRTGAWAILLFAAFSLPNLYAAELAFAAFSFLLLAMTAHMHRWQAVPEAFPPGSDKLRATQQCTKHLILTIKSCTG